MAITTTGNLTFLGVDDLEAAKSFYENVIGLRFIADEGGTLLFDMDGTPLRISAIEQFKPQSFSVLGWMVADIDAETDKLLTAGVQPVRYAGMPHDDAGIVTLGTLRIVWFTDPAGNLLSLTQA